MPFKIEPSFVPDQVKVIIRDRQGAIKHQCVMSKDSWTALSDFTRLSTRAFWAMHGITEEDDFNEPDRVRGEVIIPLQKTLEKS